VKSFFITLWGIVLICVIVPYAWLKAKITGKPFQDPFGFD
jgi:hypothetical protein